MNTATNSRGRSMPQPPMPPANNVPAPRNTQDQVWAEEAARAAQRHFDMAAEIVRLTSEMEDWRRRALGAEAEIKRLELREQNLQQQLDNRNTQLSNERDLFKETVVRLSSQFGSATQIILEAHKLMDEVLGKKPQQVNLGALADAIDEKSMPLEEPIPAVVRAGPRTDGD